MKLSKGELVLSQDRAKRLNGLPISNDDLLSLETDRDSDMASTHRNLKTAPSLVDNEDELNVDIQRKIEEQIRQTNVAVNLEAALEHLPESFAEVPRRMNRCR